MSDAITSLKLDEYELVPELLAAAEITPALVGSLPKHGSRLAKFGEQVEIYDKNNNKSFGQVGEFLVVVGDNYFSIPREVFRVIFTKKASAGVELAPGPVADKSPTEKGVAPSRGRKKVSDVPVDGDKAEEPAEAE